MVSFLFHVHLMISIRQFLLSLGYMQCQVQSINKPLPQAIWSTGRITASANQCSLRDQSVCTQTNAMHFWSELVCFYSVSLTLIYALRNVCVVHMRKRERTVLRCSIHHLSIRRYTRFQLVIKNISRVLPSIPHACF